MINENISSPILLCNNLYNSSLPTAIRHCGRHPCFLDVLAEIAHARPLRAHRDHARPKHLDTGSKCPLFCHCFFPPLTLFFCKMRVLLVAQKKTVVHPLGSVIL